MMNNRTPSSPLKRRLIIGLGAGALIATLGFAGTAMARPGGGGFPGMGMMRLMSRLDLTEQQEVKAVRLRRSLAEEGKASRQEMHQTIALAIPELEKAQPDARKLHGLVDQAVERMGKLGHSALDKFLDLHSTLTAEQRKTLVESAKEFQTRAAQRGEDGEMGRRGGKQGRRFE